jgi:hypothetical protein
LPNNCGWSETLMHVMCSICIYYIVEILKNTQSQCQWDIFHIFTSEDIDDVTFSNLLLDLLSVKFHEISCLGLYNKQNITRWLEDIGLLSSRVKNNIFVLKTIFEDKSHMKSRDRLEELRKMQKYTNVGIKPYNILVFKLMNRNMHWWTGICMI